MAFSLRDCLEVAKSLGIKLEKPALSEPELVEKYNQKYQVYHKIYPAVKALYDEL